MYFLISLLLLLHFLFFNDFAFCAEIEGIHEEKLRDWANDVATKRVDTLLAEYNYLESEVRKHPAHSETREFDKKKNWPFNHYPIAACLDKTRVTLNVGPFSQYINANYVGGIGETKRFIATPCPVLAKNVPANHPNGTGQPGPKENTIYDFWSMILQEKVDTIVMLCDAVEPPTIPWVCINYWHDGNNPSMEYATPHWPKLRKIRLNMIGNVSQINSSLFKTQIDVSRKYEIKGKLRVDHIQWRGWPDHGLPTEDHAQDVESDTIKLLELLEKKKKIVVHCSAGIGRTGTILALHLALHKLKQDKVLNVQEVVEELRSQRAYSVQKDVQYLYIYSVLLRFAMNKKYTNLNTEAIVKKIQEIAAKIKELSAPKPTGVQTGAQESPKAGAFTHLAAAGEGSSSICATGDHCG